MGAAIIEPFLMVDLGAEILVTVVDPVKWVAVVSLGFNA
jgi:hypothetical protein